MPGEFEYDVFLSHNQAAKAVVRPLAVAETGVGKGIEEGDKESRLTRTALAGLLEELAPANYLARQWGSLSRIRMPDNSYRWLCEECARRAR